MVRWTKHPGCVSVDRDSQPLPSAGFAAAQMFTQGICYTYDDVIFHPGHIDFGAHEVRIQHRQPCTTALQQPAASLVERHA